MIDFEQHKAALTQHCRQWSVEIHKTTPVDRREVESAVRTLYGVLRKPDPIIIHSQSPWQLSLIRAVLENALDEKSGQWLTDAVRSSRAEPNNSSELCRKMWQ